MITFTSTAEGITVQVGMTDRIMVKRVREVLESIGAETGDPAAERLQQSIYGTDEPAARDIEAMMQHELDAGRREDLAVVDAALAGSGRVLLTEDQADAWVRVLGDARLAVAARLGVQDDSWESDRSGGLRMAFLHYLTYAQASLTDALLNQIAD